MTSDAAAKLWDNTINQEIFNLIHSPNSHDKLGGLLAIGMYSFQYYHSMILTG
jgi:FKBP12-rapamycin complex-associated protein